MRDPVASDTRGDGLPDDTAQQLAALARALQADESSALAIDRIPEAARALVPGATAVGVSIARRREPPVTAAATCELATAADALQVELGEGPCFDAAWDQPVVSCPDLRQEGSWPTWSARMVADLGLHSLLCVRLFTRDDHVGALSLYSTEVDAFDEDDVETALAVAAHAAVAVAQAVRVEQLQTALDSRTVIGQAVGLVMSEHQLGSQDAFHLLTQLASQGKRKLVAVARTLVEAHDRAIAVDTYLADHVKAERTVPVPGPPDRRGQGGSDPDALAQRSR